MKKLRFIIAALVIIVAINSSATAMDCNYSEKDMCAAQQKVNGPVSSTISKVTGMNWLLSSVVQSQVKKQLDNAMTADFKVKVTPYGGKSLINGKFKKITAHSDSAYMEGFYISNVNAESLCPYNHFIYKGGQVYTNENFLLGFSSDVTSADLQKTMNNPQYLKLINSMNVSVGNISVFKVSDPKAEVRNNKLVFSLKIASPLSFGEPKLVSAEMGLAVAEGKIVFTEVRTCPSFATVNLNSILPLFNKLNPFTYSASILNNPKSIIKVKDIQIVNNKIVIKGLVIVPKNYYN